MKRQTPSRSPSYDPRDAGPAIPAANRENDRYPQPSGPPPPGLNNPYMPPYPYYTPPPPRSKSCVLAFLGGFLVASALVVFLVFVAFVLSNTDTSQYIDNGQNTDLPYNLDYDGVEDIYDLLRKQYDGELDEEALINGLKKGLVTASGDRHSVYYEPDEAVLFKATLNNEGIVGIGIFLGEEKGHFVVSHVIENTPAQEAGLKSDDRIVEVDGVSTSGLAFDQVLSRIKGKEGETVTLLIHRDKVDNNEEVELEFMLVRRLVHNPSVVWSITDDGIGVLAIRGFIFDNSSDGERTDELVQEAAEEFHRQNVKGVVLDLRNNGGGHLSSVSGIAGVWLESGQEVVTIKSADIDGPGHQVKETYYASGYQTPPLADLALVVLMNRNSASASEVLIGALDDYGLGIFVGEMTYGKTSVQGLYDFKDGGLLKLTHSHWYTPQNRVLNGGFTPEIEIEDDKDTDEDEQMEKALEIIRQTV